MEVADAAVSEMIAEYRALGWQLSLAPDGHPRIKPPTSQAIQETSIDAFHRNRAAIGRFLKEEARQVSSNGHSNGKAPEETPLVLSAVEGVAAVEVKPKRKCGRQPGDRVIDGHVVHADGSPAGKRISDLSRGTTDAPKSKPHPLPRRRVSVVAQFLKTRTGREIRCIVGPNVMQGILVGHDGFAIQVRNEDGRETVAMVASCLIVEDA